MLFTGDFDPDEHDKRMAALFSSYDNEAGEENYPEIDENEHEDLRWENWDEYHGEEAAAVAEASNAEPQERTTTEDDGASGCSDQVRI